ncbi:MAG: threonine/serine exporter family protein [Clostridia bacterium]|nr:threonine/serine exporter family protein [Clostridia bacterium]
MAEYTEREISLVLSAALDIGESMLETGAEIHRVEDTVERICLAYGAERADVFSIISLIVATFRTKEGHHKTQSRRVYAAGTNLCNLEVMNALSRRICCETPPPEDLAGLIREAHEKQKEKRLAVLWRLLGGMMAVGAFVIFFGGTILDALIAAVIALPVQIVSQSDPRGFNMLAKTFISAFIAGVLAVLAVRLGIGQNADKIMIGTIMLLIPGLAFGASLRDMLCGDIMAGSLRLIQSMLLAIVIASGYALAILLPGTSFGISDAAAAPLLVVIAGVLGTVGFSITFRIRWRRLAFAAIGGLIASVVYVAVSHHGGDYFVANLVAAIAVTSYAEIMARLIKTPVTVLLIPGIVPLVPGGMLYYTMRYLVIGDTERFRDAGIGTALTGLGIAVGLMIVSLTAHVITGQISAGKKRQKK